MAVSSAVLVLADISGYTRFLTLKSMSVVHADAIISDLLESVIDNAEFPLTLNKLEGDAAFLYAKFPEERRADAVRDVLKQVGHFHQSFEERRKEWALNRLCICDGCKQVEQLRLKSFVHVGTALFKKVRQFEELVGEDVILIHRLLKNQVKSNEYVLMSDAAFVAAGDAGFGTPDQSHREFLEGLGECDVHVFAPPRLSAVQTNPQPRFSSRLGFLGFLHMHMLRRMMGTKKRRPPLDYQCA